MKRFAPLLVLCCVPVLSGQTVLLENFSTMRTAGDGTSLWIPQADINAGSVTTCQPLANNLLTCTAAPQGTGPVPNGIGIWFYDRNTSGYTFPASYLQNWVLSGTWNTQINRLRFQYRCTNTIPSPAPSHNIEFGTYTRSPSDPSAGNSGQGTHYYHFTGSPVYPNRWVYVEFNRVPEHVVSDYGGANYPEDPEWVQPVNAGYPTHYYDGMTHFYWSGANLVNSRALYSGTCSLANLTASTVAGGADNWVHSITATYDPNHFGSGAGAYQLTWQAPKWAPAGITYDVRYSTAASMKTNGWSTGVPAGTITSPAGSADVTALYTSPQMAQAGVMYFALRPHLAIQSVTASAPIAVTTLVDHNLAGGDQVVISGVNNGSHPANGTWAVTPLAAPVFRIGDGTVVKVVSSGTTATATTSTAHGLLPGRSIKVRNSWQELLNAYGNPQVITSVPSPTTFTWTVPSVPSATTFDNTNSPSMQIAVMAAFSLNGSNGSAAPAYTANTGTATATSNTSNFAEIVVPSDCDLNFDGVVNQSDVTLATNAALGQGSCKADLDQNGSCNVIDVQRVINAANGQGCRVGP